MLFWIVFCSLVVAAAEVGALVTDSGLVIDEAGGFGVAMLCLLPLMVTDGAQGLLEPGSRCPPSPGGTDVHDARPPARRALDPDDRRVGGRGLTTHPRARDRSDGLGRPAEPPAAGVRDRGVVTCSMLANTVAFSSTAPRPARIALGVLWIPLMLVPSFRVFWIYTTPPSGLAVLTVAVLLPTSLALMWWLTAVVARRRESVSEGENTT